MTSAATTEVRRTSREEPRPFLEVRDAVKAYGAVQALRGVDFRISPGEVVGLVGHNGAGKSTLMNIIAGTVRRTSGSFSVAGKPVGDWSPHQAQLEGLRCVFQELSLCANLTAAENTRIVHRPLRGLGWRRRARALIRRALDDIFPGHGIPVEARTADLPIGTRQMIEIARAFSETDTPVRCVILDEPTSALGHEAANQLLSHVRHAAGRGVSCILITHRLDEIMAIADRAIVMVDGRIAAERRGSDLSRATLVGLMGAVEAPRDRRPAAGDAAAGPSLLAEAGRDGDRPIRAGAGEIVGFAGLDGHGQRERLQALYRAGRRQSKAQGGAPVAFVAGDRGTEGVFTLWSVAENLTIRSLRALRRGFLLSPDAERALAGTWTERLKVRTPSLDAPILSLSGGNQQKVLFARALASDAAVIFLDDPMRGVDVNTKQEVYGLIRTEAAKGRCFVWYATELEELTNCQRLYVFREGKAVAYLAGEEVEPARILEASFGGGRG